MKRLEKLFFGLRMTWKHIVLFAVVTGVVTGILMQIPFLDGTSFQDIGISYECWILFAILICMNCEKPVEAACKTFVFFLISQPLVYLTMWPQYHCFPWHYYRFWGIMTVLTLPGGFICWQVKRKNILSALILSVATGFLVCLAGIYLVPIFRAGGVPYHLLTAIFCLVQAVVLIAVLLPGKRERLIAAIITLAAAAVFTVTTLRGDIGSAAFEVEGCDNCVCVVEDERIASVEPNGYEQLDVTAHRVGETTVTCTMQDGTVVTMQITVEGDGSIHLKPLS